MNEGEHLAAVNNHIAQSPLGADKFPDDHAHETKTDVDLHDGEEIRDIGGQYDLEKYMRGVAVKRADELDLIRGGLHKAGVEV